MKHSTLHLALFMFGLAVSYTPQPLPSYTPQPPPSYSFKPSLSYGPQPSASYNPKPSPSCSTIIIPPAAATGPTTAQFTAGTLPFDAPFLDRVNATSWELWYYDVISPDAHASFTMGFFSTPFSAFQLLPDLGSLDMVAIWGSFPNGTAFRAIVPATEAVITVGPAGSTGDWKDTGVSWASDSGGKDYAVRFDSPKTGITGSMTLQSVCCEVSDTEFDSALTALEVVSTTYTLWSPRTRPVVAGYRRHGMGEYCPQWSRTR